MSTLSEPGTIPWGDVPSRVRSRRGSRFSGLELYDGANTTSRRRGMIEYLQHHGLGHSSLSTRLKIFAKVCELVHSKGQEEISQAAFDWQVDRALWELHFCTFRPSRRPAWPWLDLWPRVLADPGPKSSEYRKYLQDHPLVVPTTVPVSGTRAPPAVLPGHVVPQSSQPVLPAVSAGAAGQPSPSGDIGNTHVARRGRPAPKASSI